VRYWWTAIKLAITLVLSAVVLLVLVPRLGTAAEMAKTLGVDAVPSTERLRLMLAPALGSTSLLALDLALAIYEPRWKPRGAPAEQRSPHPEHA
jgi:hypothetical protein